MGEKMEEYDPIKFNKKIKISKNRENYFEKKENKKKDNKIRDFNLINTSIILIFFLFFGNIILLKRDYFFFGWIFYLFSVLPLLFYHIFNKENKDLVFIYLIFVLINVFCFTSFLLNFLFNLNMNKHLLFLFPSSLIVLLLFNFYFFPLLKIGKKYFIYNIINLIGILKLSFTLFFINFLIELNFTYPFYFFIFITLLNILFFFHKNKKLKTFLISIFFNYLLVLIIFKYGLININLLFK